jgi:hypothetical protein
MQGAADGVVAPLVFMSVNQARGVLGVSANALKGRVRSGSLRGWPPGQDPNRSKQWVFDWVDVARLAREKGLPCPPPGGGEATAAVAVGEARVETENLRAGYELAQAAAAVARQDLTRAEVAALQGQLEQLRKENSALRAALRALASPELD